MAKTEGLSYADMHAAGFVAPVVEAQLANSVVPLQKIVEEIIRVL